MQHFYSIYKASFSCLPARKKQQLPSFRYSSIHLCWLALVLGLFSLSGLKAATISGVNQKVTFNPIRINANDSLETQRLELRSKYLLRMQLNSKNNSTKPSREKQRAERKHFQKLYYQALDSVRHDAEQRRLEQEKKQKQKISG